MSKIRINDLARELEVKSKSILDVLPEIGVTEKKSHSSSLEDHEAEKVRAQFRAASQAQTSSRTSRPGRADADEIKTKIDLSHISKPGDALKAIISKQQAPAAAPPATAPAPVETKPAFAATPPAVRAPLPKPPSPPPPAAPPKFVVPTSTPRPTFTAPPPPTPPPSAAPAPPPAASSAPVAPRPAVLSPATPPVSATPGVPAATPLRPPVSQPTAPTMVARPAAPVASAPPQAPPPRMIVPQTGPRPVYKAPLRPAPPASARRSSGRWNGASCAGTSGTRTTDFSTAASGRAIQPAAITTGRAQADASHAPVADRNASAGCRAGGFASGADNPARQPPRSAVTQAGAVESRTLQPLVSRTAVAQLPIAAIPALARGQGHFRPGPPRWLG